MIIFCIKQTLPIFLSVGIKWIYYSSKDVFSVKIKLPLTVFCNKNHIKWTKTSPFSIALLNTILKKEPKRVQKCGDDMEQKIKQDEIFIGQNIRRIRKEKGMRQTEMVALMQLKNVPLTREALVKIERGIQHIQASQLRAIRDVLETTYDDLLK